MKKPKQKTFAPHYEYNEVMNYLQDKYQIDPDDFWDWFSKWGTMHNGCFKHIPFNTEDYTMPVEAEEIVELMRKEFDPENKAYDLRVWVEW